ncbi:MAG: hypothetical protein ACLQGP_20165 [Isosphaeraceae bacterium]
MNLHDELLDQAQQLARWDPRRPRQVNLRRAVSSAYYALFHLLSSETSALFAIESDLAARINRTLNHGDMKKSSMMIGNGKLPKAVQSQLRGYTTPADLKTVTSTFIKLQEVRHFADYDLSKTFRRQEVLDYIQLACEAFEAWKRIRKTDDARLYLASFLLWKRWDEDPR